MKIRIKDNSLRFRLTRSEVATLWENRRLEAHTDFPGNRLTYAIEVSAEDKLTTDFHDYRITLYMPQKMMEELQTTDIVGFEDKTGGISLLVEKDFVCIDNTSEDQSDHYPNPSLNC